MRAYVGKKERQRDRIQGDFPPQSRWHFKHSVAIVSPCVSSRFSYVGYNHAEFSRDAEKAQENPQRNNTGIPNICASPNLGIKVLTSNKMIRERVLWKVIILAEVVRAGALRKGLVPLWEETPENPSPWGDTHKKLTVCNPRNETSQEPNRVGVLISGLYLSPWIMRNTFLLSQSTIFHYDSLSWWRHKHACIEDGSCYHLPSMGRGPVIESSDHLHGILQPQHLPQRLLLSPFDISGHCCLRHCSSLPTSHEAIRVKVQSWDGMAWK